jgi:hypothetical protein
VQVRNLRSAIKVALDFVSPEAVGECQQLREEFRYVVVGGGVCVCGVCVLGGGWGGGGGAAGGGVWCVCVCGEGGGEAS